MRESPALSLQECMGQEVQTLRELRTAVRHLLINVSPDSDLRQIVGRGHGGQYQGGSERFCVYNVFQKRASKLGP